MTIPANDKTLTRLVERYGGRFTAEEIVQRLLQANERKLSKASVRMAKDLHDERAYKAWQNAAQRLEKFKTKYGIN